MNDRQFPDNQPPNTPWGPPPSVPPELSSQQPYADPFAGMTTTPAPVAPKGRKEGLWVALAALVGAAAVIGGVAWYSQRDTVDDELAGRDVTPRTTQVAPDGSDQSVEEAPVDEPASGDSEISPDEVPDTSANAVCPEGTRQEVCDAARFVEDFRGRPFQTFPVVEFADEGEFQERLLDDVDQESIDSTETQGDVLGSLGLIAPGVDLVEVSTQSLEIGVVGFYDPVSKELVIRGSDIDPFVELIIVHELVHAHDDQWLDLDRPEIEDLDDETFLGFLAVVEGNASRVEDAWRSELSAEKERELSNLEISFYGPDEIAILQQIPSFVLESQFFPYQDGPVLVRAIAAAAGGGEAGERAVDEAILNPPATSEQALHPDQYLNGDAAPTVPAPAASGDIIDEGVIGELVFDIWFGDRAGDGWNGDRYVSFERDGQTCTVIQVAADSGDDLDELFDAAADWVGEAEDGDLRRSDQSTVDGIDVVIIEGCR